MRKEQRRSECRMTTATCMEMDASGRLRWTPDSRDAARTLRVSATRHTGTFGGERQFSIGCVRAEARQWLAREQIFSCRV